MIEPHLSMDENERGKGTMGDYYFVIVGLIAYLFLLLLEKNDNDRNCR